MNCSHNIKRLSLCWWWEILPHTQIKETARTRAHTFRAMRVVHIHRYTPAYIHTDTRTQMPTIGQRCITHPHTPAHSSFLPLSGGLLEPLLKSKQFHSNLWPTVFRGSAWLIPCGIRGRQTVGPLERYRDLVNFGFIAKFFHTQSNVSLVKSWLKQWGYYSKLSPLVFMKILCQ